MSLKQMYRATGEKHPVIGVRLVLRYEGGREETINYVPVDFEIRYGTNPHQRAAVLVPEGYKPRIRQVKKGTKAPSVTNIGDLFWAAQNIKYSEDPAVAVMKHDNSSGFAVSDKLLTAFLRAWYSDWIAAFGSSIGFNKPLDLETAEALVEAKVAGGKEPKYFIEAIAAPDFEEGVMAVLERRQGLRAFVYEGLENLPKFIGDDDTPWLRTLGNAHYLLTVEDPWLTVYRTPQSLLEGHPDPELQSQTGVVTQRRPTDPETNDLWLAKIVAANLKSNGVAVARDGYCISAGTGQQDRVRAVRHSIGRAKDLQVEALRGGLERYGSFSLEGAALASDGFFPFRDSADECNAVNITAIVQPGGSTRDEEVINAANEAGIAMIFTGERDFRH